MEFEDRLRIATPEGVDLELTLAGVGSRFTSALLDYLIQLLILIALALVLGLGVGLKANASGYAAAIWGLLAFLLFVGYDVAFEVLASGRTPGKRLNGLRVVLENGGPVTFPASAVRDVVGLVGFLPRPHLVGVVAILGSSGGHPPRDHAAGTALG